MVRYKIGDRVLIRDDLVLGEMYDGRYFGPIKETYCGKQATITGIHMHSTLDTLLGYYLDIDKGCWLWTESMLLPYSKQFNNLLMRGE